MMDLVGCPVQIRISNDGKTVWINTPHGCAFRAEKIPELHIDDMRKNGI